MQVSLAVFGPQSRAPTPSYLRSIQTFVANHHVLKCIRKDISSLHQVWRLITEKNAEIAALPQGPRYIGFLTQWLLDGTSEEAASTSSGIVALPRLAIIQFAQYFQFIESKSMSHAEFICQLRDSGGSMQGYCGGLVAAIALACATDEQELAQSICTAIRLAFAIGLYAELGDDSQLPGITTMVVRLKWEGQAEELVRMFPRTYVSAVTDPKSVSIVGTAVELASMQTYVKEQGLLVQPMDIRGKTHNPENVDLAVELSTLCRESALINLGLPDRLQVSIRSNRDGALLTQGSLSQEIVDTVLASRCEWFQLLINVAADLKRTKVESHAIVSFGIGDCVPLMPFNKAGVQMTKTDWSAKEQTSSSQPAMVTALPNSCINHQDAIAIVGASCRFPGANNMDELWDIISTGQDRHEELKPERFDLYNSHRSLQSENFTRNRKFYGNFIEGVDRFDNAFFGTNSREMTNMDPQQRMLLELSYEAMESSGYTRSHVRSRGDNIGCFIGASFVEYLDNTNAHPPTAYTSTGTIRAFLCGRLSYHFGWSGPAEVIDTACSSSLVAINRAVKAIRGGECAVALTGGINLITGANNFQDLAKAGFLSPTGQCKPFDKDADGYCRAEGAGLVVLKTLQQAQADGDRIMAVIAGAATNQGGLSSGITVPDPNAQMRLYRAVLDQAALTPEQVTYVEAHGTGTQAGDPLEISSLVSVFGSDSRSEEIYIGSIKGNIGHCETAAGVAGLLKVVSMLEHKAIPPQASHKVWNPKIPDPSRHRMTLSKSLKTWDAPVRAAMINSYGAAGSNAAVLCCEAPEQPRPDRHSLRESRHVKQPIILSAASVSSLRSYQNLLAKYIAKRTPQPNIEEIAYTLSERRQRHKNFIVFEASNTAELIEMLLGDVKGQTPALEREISPRKPLVLVFGGQSKQTIGLCKDIYERFITFRTHVNRCDTILQQLGYPSILPAIFQTGSNITDMVVLQTGFVAVQYAAAATWVDASLQIDAVIGHSLGELTALAISGKLSIHDCLQLVGARAALMKKHWGRDNGAMLAVFASRQAVEDALASVQSSSSNEKKSTMVIACYNSETSQVVSGDSASVARLESHLCSPTVPGQQPLKFLRVDTSHGFHSCLVDPILEELDQVSSSLEWRTATIPIEVCSPDPSPGRGAALAPYSPSSHARNPVFFADAVHRLEQRLGRCVWLEAGIDTPIVSMTKRAVSQLDGHSFHAVSTKGVDVPINVIPHAVCHVWSCSADVTHWSFLQADSPPNAVWLPPYAFDHTVAWLDNIDRAAELQRKLNKCGAQAPIHSEAACPERRNMVTLLHAADKPEMKRFRVSFEGERLRKIVLGHAVRSRPLCPASVYLECVTMALDLVTGHENLGQSSLEFKDLDIQAPLGVAAANVELVLHDLTANCQWEFSVMSRHPERPGRTTLHAKGRVTMSPEESNLDATARLASRQMKTVEASEAAERMLSRRAYQLFSRVVNYETFLEGIASVTLNGNEAVATIAISASQPGVEDSTVVRTCDAVTLDNFIQVVGLLMNTSDGVGKSEVMVCTGVKCSTIVKGCNMTDCRSWKVYASYTPTSASQAMGDVFAWSEDGSIAATLTGCRFAKLDMVRLEKLLDPVNCIVSSNQGDSTESFVPEKSEISCPKASGLADPRRDITPPETPPLSMESSLRQILETYTGFPAASMVDDAVIADLGLDLLAATELASELQTANGNAIDCNELLSMTIHQLDQKLGHVASKLLADFPRTASHIPGGPDKAVYTPTKTDDERISGSALILAKKLTELLFETTGISSSSIKPQATLEALGVDSLALAEILSALGGIGPIEVNTDGINLKSKVEDLLHAIGATADAGGAVDRDIEHAAQPKSSLLLPPTHNGAIFEHKSTTHDANEPWTKRNPLTAFRACEEQFENVASSHGFQNYWNKVGPDQDNLVLAYVLEAFQNLGVDVASLAHGECVPSIAHHAKHTKVVRRLWELLQKHGIVRQGSGGSRDWVRDIQSAPALSSTQLNEQFIRNYPPYAIEARLLALTGPNLAQCLKGDVDPIKLLFGTSSSNRILEEYYSHSPMLSTLTSQLVTFIMGCLETPSHYTSRAETLKILEIGAGTGGTTAELAEKLAAAGVPVEYKFSDVSSIMVCRARNRFATKYGWMSFERLDLEQPPPAHLEGRFDFVIGTNCVHATRDHAATVRRIRQMLNQDGFMVLSEVTRIVDWYDLVFGLLDGWWLANGGNSYPLQPAETWMAAFRKAGFASGMFSQGASDDANTQKLLVGCNREIAGLSGGGFTHSHIITSETPSPRLEKKTVVYKEVDGVQIEAEIFLPAVAPAQPMAIALMIHGGGHMTLSRRAVRPAQTAFLAVNGVLPVSLDYRLCPEINIIDGAMEDVRDAVTWARLTLPLIAANKNISLDTERIVVIGWSTGGHLAMSTAWTVEAAGEMPPKAILSFYAPTNFLAKDVFPPHQIPTPVLPSRRMSREDILRTAVSANPITNYDMHGQEDLELGWVKSGDSRSELLLSLFESGSREFGLSLMLNGSPGGHKTVGELVASPPSLERQAAICPTARLRMGQYKVPTFIIHGELDDIALFESAANLYDEMKQQGTPSGFLAVDHGGHLHDLHLKVGMPQWDRYIVPGYQFLFDMLKK